ncbi:MAG: hypothetical protein BroJett015_01110 [Chloroflexota bacterium]|nr:MAG: hypothetical protein BroJett015_01110 [Chloroflexota bacterium]
MAFIQKQVSYGHRPGLEMQRLTPSNRQKLLFDDVIWTRKARQDHDAFVDLMREEAGVKVMRVHELLEEVVADPEGKAYILDRKITANEVGVGVAPELRAWLDSLEPAKLVAHLIGGVTIAELPGELGAFAQKAWSGANSWSPRCPTSCSPATALAEYTAG